MCASRSYCGVMSVEKTQNVITAVLKNLGLRKRYNEEYILLHWSDIVGNEIAKHSQPARFERGLIFLCVSNSVWAHHLSMMKKNMIDKINAYVGEFLITDIRYQAGNFQHCQNDANNEYAYPVFKPASIHLSSEEITAVENYASVAADGEIKMYLSSFIGKHMKMKKFKLYNDWHQCEACSVLCPPEQRFCTSCYLEQRHVVLEKIRSLLNEAPWLKYHELYKYIPCEPYEYDIAKDELTGRLSRDVQQGETQKDKILLATLTMLMTCMKPDDINDGIMEMTWQKLRRKTYVSASGS